jgi:hypothetical protein
MYSFSENGVIIIELETGIDSQAKLQHTLSQVQNYLKLRNQYRSREFRVALVYADEFTPPRFKNELVTFANQSDILLKSYSIQKILHEYNLMVNQLNFTSGISLGRAVALGITSISWLKKFMLPFVFWEKKLARGDLKSYLGQLWGGDNDHHILGFT